MRKYTLFQAPIMAFYSGSFYRDVGLHWTGTGFAYLLLLLIICWVPRFIQFQHSLSNFAENQTPALISQIPEIRIIEGKASVAVAQPHRITDGTGKLIALIDTTGGTASLEETGATMLVTKTEVIYKKSDVETRNFSFKKIHDFTLNQEKLTAWVNLLRNYGSMLLFPFAVVGSFIFRIVQLLIYAAIGFLFARWCDTRVSYQALLRLSAMAVTPVIIVAAVAGLLDVKIAHAGTFYFAAAMAYLFRGVKVLSRPQEDQIPAGVSPAPPPAA